MPDCRSCVWNSEVLSFMIHLFSYEDRDDDNTPIFAKKCNRIYRCHLPCALCCCDAIIRENKGDKFSKSFVEITLQSFYSFGILRKNLIKP